MWILRLLLKHDCIIGKRCKKYACTSTGYPLEHYKEGKDYYFLNFEKIGGKPEDIADFLKDLKTEPNLVQFEANENMVFFVCKKRKKGEMPAQLATAAKKVFHTKPVFVDNKGVEHWEVAAWRRKDINDFISYVKEKTYQLEEIKIIEIKQVDVTNMFFPQLMPRITDLQNKAIEIAIEHGYYDYPHRVELKELAKLMGVSLSTYRQHLRKAEKALLPTLQKNIFSFRH